MLKIKDNVDLKELEKYEFRELTFSYQLEFDCEDYSIILKIDKNTKYIYIQNDYYDSDYTSKIPNVLYDLIKADLVEKVDDNNGNNR